MKSTTSAQTNSATRSHAPPSEDEGHGSRSRHDLAALGCCGPRGLGGKDERGRDPHLAPIRQRIESIFWTAKDILGLERHGARTLDNLRVRLVTRFAALAAAVALNHRLHRPTRSLACYTT